MLSLDGSTCIKETITKDLHPVGLPSNEFTVTDSQVVVDNAFSEAVHDAEELGRLLADTLKERGANDVLRVVRGDIAVAQNDLRMPKAK